jgi:two-component system response regulator FixJ
MDDRQKVAIIDDDPAILDSLQLSLTRKGFEVICFDAAKNFIDQVDAGLSLHCVVCDVKMPGMTGLVLQQLLSERGPSLPLIFITGHGDVDMAVNAVKAGAFDFIEKPIDDGRLAASIGQAISRHRSALADRQEIAALRSRYRGLSDRQQQVVALAVEGLSNKEIALRLGISPRTVEHYRESAMDRMQAASFAQLVQMAVRLKVLTRAK